MFIYFSLATVSEPVVVSWPPISPCYSTGKWCYIRLFSTKLWFDYKWEVLCSVRKLWEVLFFKYGKTLHVSLCWPSRPGHCEHRGLAYKWEVAVVVAFFICWAPFHAQRLLAIHYSRSQSEPPAVVVLIYNALTYVSGVLYYVSATINPILYHIMSLKFRLAFKDTLGRCGRRVKHSRGGKFNGSFYSFNSTVRSRVLPEQTDITIETLLQNEQDNNGHVLKIANNNENNHRQGLNKHATNISQGGSSTNNISSTKGKLKKQISQSEESISNSSMQVNEEDFNPIELSNLMAEMNVGGASDQRKASWMWWHYRVIL